MGDGPKKEETVELGNNNVEVCDLESNNEDMNKILTSDGNKMLHDMAVLETVKANQEIRLQKVEEAIKKYERNLWLQDVQQSEQKELQEDLKKELEVVQEKIDKQRVSSQKKINALKQRIAEERESLEKMKKMEEEHQLTMFTREKELKDTYEEQKKKVERNYLAAEAKNKAKEADIQKKVKNLNEELATVERDITAKEYVLKNLKMTHHNLEKKLYELTWCGETAIPVKSKK